jgi:hypothetical protein
MPYLQGLPPEVSRRLIISVRAENSKERDFFIVLVFFNFDCTVFLPFLLLYVR